MLHIGQKISEMVSQEKLDVNTIAERLGKSKQAVYDMFAKEDLNTSLLRQFSDILNVPLVSFFDEGGVADLEYKNLAEANKEIKKLREEVVILKSGVKPASAKVLLELELNKEEIVKLNLKDKVIQILNQ